MKRMEPVLTRRIRRSSGEAGFSDAFLKRRKRYEEAAIWPVRRIAVSGRKGKLLRKVTVAKTAGFCFGVERAVNMVYKEAEEKGGNIYTYGPIIHNEQVVSDLEDKGVRVIGDIGEIENLPKGSTIIIRSHGAKKEVYDRVRAAGLTLVDATCPFVRKIHRIVEKRSAEGAAIIIIGSPHHPEVQGICGWACDPGKVFIIESEEQAADFSSIYVDNFCIVSQTTFNLNKFHKLVEILAELGYDKRDAVNTICNATEERQTEARQLAAVSDVMIVIGGRHSSNTQKLYDICASECKETFYIQTLVDLDIQRLPSSGCVGITAGASTPKNIIEEVSKHVRNEF